MQGRMLCRMFMAGFFAGYRRRMGEAEGRLDMEIEAIDLRQRQIEHGGAAGLQGHDERQVGARVTGLLQQGVDADVVFGKDRSDFGDDARTVIDHEADVMRNSEVSVDRQGDFHCRLITRLRRSRLAGDGKQIGNNGHGGGVASGSIPGERDLPGELSGGEDQVLASLHVSHNRCQRNERGANRRKNTQAVAGILDGQ